MAVVIRAAPPPGGGGEEGGAPYPPAANPSPGVVSDRPAWRGRGDSAATIVHPTNATLGAAASTDTRRPRSGARRRERAPQFAEKEHSRGGGRGACATGLRGVVNPRPLM